MQDKVLSLSEIAPFIAAEIRGDKDFQISGIAPLDRATNNKISFLERKRFRKYLRTTKAGAVILTAKDVNFYAGNCLIVDNPYLAYAKLSVLFDDAPKASAGIHSSVVIGNNCTIPDSVAIGANCVLGNDVLLGENSVLEPGCVLADGVQIGADCYLHANVSIYHKVVIGARTAVHSGAVIGADGFGMANNQGKWEKIYQLGSVKIGNDVEIGANACIDRGALDDTIIEDGVKIDNQVQIAHNVKIGANTAMAGCSGIAGSTKIGKNCMIGGAAIIGGHLEIADGVIITGGAGVARSIAEQGIYTSGINVVPHRDWMKILSRIYDLDNLAARIQKLEERANDNE